MVKGYLGSERISLWSNINLLKHLLLIIHIRWVISKPHHAPNTHFLGTKALFCVLGIKLYYVTGLAKAQALKHVWFMLSITNQMTQGSEICADLFQRHPIMWPLGPSEVSPLDCILRGNNIRTECQPPVCWITLCLMLMWSTCREETTRDMCWGKMSKEAISEKDWQPFMDAVKSARCESHLRKREEVDLETLRPGDKRLELVWNSDMETKTGPERR